jgi:hypothetical protein
LDWWIDCLLPASVIQPQALTLVTKRTDQATAFRAPVEQLSHPRNGSSGSDYARFPERIPDRCASFFPVPLPSYPPTPDSKPPRRTRLKIHLFVPSILFHVLLTFLSKFFSTFVRTTSPLSVFCVIFRFGRTLPPILRRNPNLRDSKNKKDPYYQ